MSLKQIMSLEQARALATEFIQEIAPYCQIICFAGSVRRLKPEVGDVEIVAIPRYGIERKPKPDLSKILGVKTKTKPKLIDQLAKKLEEMVSRQECRFGKNGPKHKELIFPGYKIDLFYADPNNFGLMKMIRTGSAKYSKQFMIEINKIGVYKVNGRYLRLNDWSNLIVPVKTEDDLYRLVGFPYKKPEDRIHWIF